jgi:hypothetical protein
MNLATIGLLMKPDAQGDFLQTRDFQSLSMFDGRECNCPASSKLVCVPVSSHAMPRLSNFTCSCFS